MALRTKYLLIYCQKPFAVLEKNRSIGGCGICLLELVSFLVSILGEMALTADISDEDPDIDIENSVSYRTYLFSETDIEIVVKNRPSSRTRNGP